MSKARRIRKISEFTSGRSVFTLRYVNTALNQSAFRIHKCYIIIFVACNVLAFCYTSTIGTKSKMFVWLSFCIDYQMPLVKLFHKIYCKYLQCNMSIHVYVDVCLFVFALYGKSLCCIIPDVAARALFILLHGLLFHTYEYSIWHSNITVNIIFSVFTVTLYYCNIGCNHTCVLNVSSQI